MVLNATFNNISAIAVSFIYGRKRSTRRKPLTCCKPMTNIMLYRIHFAMSGIRITTLVVIETDYTGSCKSNYYTITTTTAPIYNPLFFYTKSSYLCPFRVESVNIFVCAIHMLFLPQTISHMRKCSIFPLSGPFAEFGFIFIDYITYFRFKCHSY
jgi:hypothetical protein